MPATTLSASTVEDDGEASARTGLFGWLKPWVRLSRNQVNWEECEEVRSNKVMIRTRPGVTLELLTEDDERARFRASLTCLDERGYYQLKVWPRSTRDFCHDEITLLAILPGGREKIVTIHASVD